MPTLSSKSNGLPGRTLLLGRTVVLLLVLMLICGPAVPLVAQTVPEPAGAVFDLALVPDALRVSDGAYYKPGEVLVAMREAPAAAGTMAQFEAVTGVAPLDVRGVEKLDRQSVGGKAPVGYTLTVPPGQEWATIDRLYQDPNVLFAQPNWVITAAQSAAPETPFVVNDPLYRGEQWYLQRIMASRAWPVANEYATDSDSVRVAVIDSGVDPTHPDFGGRVLPIKSYVRDAWGQLITVDDFGHGTHIAGLIGATLNNGVGIAGMASNTTIDPYKVLDYLGNGYISNAADAIRAATDNDADIVNMSFSIPASVINNPGNANLDYLLHSAIYFARDNDVLLVAAAGNRYPEPVTFPAAYPEVMAVAATDYNNDRSYYSAVGNEIDLAAPGGTSSQPLGSTWPVGLPCASTVGGVQGYCNKYGTSFSTGLVSGSAALLLTMDPTLTSDQLWEMLIASTMPIGGDETEVGAGLLDTNAVVRSLLTPRAVLVGGDVGLAAAPRTAPIQHRLFIKNASRESVSWTLSRPADAPWLVFTDRPNSTRTISGLASFHNQPEVGLTLSPGALPPGVYTARMTFTSGEGDGAEVREFDVKMALLDVTEVRYAPIAAANGIPTNPQGTGAFRWEAPDSAGRTTINLSGDQSVQLALPFLFPFGGRSYTDTRVHANGFLTFPGGETESSVPNGCLPTVAWPGQAIYGWGADLEPNANGGRISTFRTVEGRYVVEFQGAPPASAAIEGVATFQMVLSDTGDIGLNYRQLPQSVRATVGVEALDSRLYNLIHCADGVSQIGMAPVGEQSFIIHPGDLY
jgi:subtilisin family serine protease